ncbi:penicillin acylase family protein [Deinococcus cavernae]|uniref:penicillin acylase family protein n=1 Tax=Deinococcus cavernae TaxID=2320857 RepID=UPI001F46C13D|nr:penicillin acylase family protein [Deinococcus cavernae]
MARGLLWLFLLLVVVLAGSFWWLRGSTTPRTTGQVNLPAGVVRGPLSVTRDAWGVPHIRAATDEDAVFALGFVHWQDRAWQMDFQRRVAQGRLSEIVGKPALKQDKFLRTWGFQRAAQSALPALSPQSRKLIAAYTAGVNAAMKQGKTALEFQILRYTPEAWSDVDSVSWSKLMAFDLGGNYEAEVTGAAVVKQLGQAGLEQVFPPYPVGAPTILSADELGKTAQAQQNGGEVAQLEKDTIRELQANLRAARALGMQAVPGKGSNDWVIGGSRTASGKPILADDPHLGLTSPMLWYLADIQGDKLKAIGASIPGLPAIVIGRNERVAWGVTNVNPDVQDLYLEPENATLTTRQEVIKVKGQPDVTLTVQESRHGPIISGEGAEGLGQRVALRWTALMGGDTTLDAFLGLNYAANWPEFTAALERYVAPSQNFVYADVDGNTGYYAPGKVPIRRGWDGSLPVKGDGSREWTGFIPFGELPHTFNPADALVVTANNKVVPDSYAYQLGNSRNWAEPYRAQRITQLLEAKRTGLTVEDVKRVQLDTHSLVWEDLKTYLLSARPDGETSGQALDLLRNWDGSMTVNSVPATIFEMWLLKLQEMGRDELKDKIDINSLAVKNQLANNGEFCGPDQTCQDDLSRTLKAAVDDLTTRLGAEVNGWEYGKLHQVASNHRIFADVKPLARIFNHTAPTPGGTNTVNVARPDHDTFRQTHGPSYRQIVDLSDLNSSVYIGSLGQSGNPLLPHAADQQPMWVAGQYLPMSTNPKDWGKTSVMTLK